MAGRRTSLSAGYLTALMPLCVWSVMVVGCAGATHAFEQPDLCSWGELLRAGHAAASRADKRAKLARNWLDPNHWPHGQAAANSTLQSHGQSGSLKATCVVCRLQTAGCGRHTASLPAKLSDRPSSSTTTTTDTGGEATGGTRMQKPNRSLLLISFLLNLNFSSRASLVSPSSKYLWLD